MAAATLATTIHIRRGTLADLWEFS
jgi:hypothetical protein